MPAVDWDQYAPADEPKVDWSNYGPPDPAKPEDFQAFSELGPTRTDAGYLTEPLVPIPTLHGESTLGKIGAGAFNVIKSIPEFMETPVGLATLPLAVIPGAGPVLKGLFAGLAAKGAGEKLGEASVSKDVQDYTEGILGAAMAPAIGLPEGILPRAAKAAVEAIKGKAEVPESVAQEATAPEPVSEPVTPQAIADFQEQAKQELPQAIPIPEVPNALVPETTPSIRPVRQESGEGVQQVPTEIPSPKVDEGGGQAQAAQAEVPLDPGATPAKGIAASVRNKWTSATESPFGSEAGFINLDPIKELWDKYSPSLKAAIEHVKGIAKEQMTLPPTSDYRRSVLNWSAKLQRSFGEAASAQKEIQDVVKDPVKRDGITNWMQAGGDPTVLQDRLAKTIAWRDPVTGKPHPQAKRLIAGYEAALKLTPEEVKIATDARNAYDTLGTRGQAHDVLNSFKDNYVTQIWDLKKGPTGGGGSRTLKDKFRFSKASTFPTYFDGEQAGFVPKTKDISKVLPVYLHEMNSVIAARQLVEQMSKGTASDGRPLLAAKGRGFAIDDPKGKTTLVVPDALHSDFSDYKTLENQPALHDWRWQTKDSAGNPVFMKADLAVHPEAYGKLKNVLGRSAIKEWYDSKGSLASSIPKGIAKGLDRGQSETKRMMLGVLTPFHQVQEVWHGVAHRVAAVKIPKIDLVNNREQMDAANHGLMMFPDRTSAEQFMEGFKQSKIVSKIPALGPLADQYSNYLFHVLIPGLKFKTYREILNRNLSVFKKDLASGKSKPEDVKILSAEQANAAYGHLNYADLGRNPTIQHIMQLGLLAPDFLEARMRFSGQALKGATGAKVGREQLVALATLGVAQATLAYIAAKSTGGVWDKKDPFAFHIGNRKFTLRSVPEDALRLATEARAFIYARLNPLLGKTAVQLISGTDWRGNKVTAGQTLKEAVQQPIPLGLRPLFGTANSPLSGWEQLAGAAGLKISRYSAQSEVRKLAHKWMADSKDPKILAAEKAYQKSTFPDSDYKPLREALINNDLKTAQQEYQKLLETKKPDLVQRTFNHPRAFSGSAARERAFKQSLSPENQKLYDQALKEQSELKAKFFKMKAQASSTSP